MVGVQEESAKSVVLGCHRPTGKLNEQEQGTVSARIRQESIDNLCLGFGGNHFRCDCGHCGKLPNEEAECGKCGVYSTTE